jgi:hypothetical protein
MGFSLLKYSLDPKFMYFHFIKNTKPKPNFFKKNLGFDQHYFTPL